MILLCIRFLNIEYCSWALFLIALQPDKGLDKIDANYIKLIDSEYVESKENEDD